MGNISKTVLMLLLVIPFVLSGCYSSDALTERDAVISELEEEVASLKSEVYELEHEAIQQYEDGRDQGAQDAGLEDDLLYYGIESEYFRGTREGEEYAEKIYDEITYDEYAKLWDLFEGKSNAALLYMHPMRLSGDLGQKEIENWAYNAGFIEGARVFFYNLDYWDPDEFYDLNRDIFED